jgi:integrase
VTGDAGATAAVCRNDASKGRIGPDRSAAARKHSRYGHRDATAILIAYRHGLRASELCDLTWNMIELDSGRIHVVRRAKNGVQ